MGTEDSTSFVSGSAGFGRRMAWTLVLIADDIEVTKSGTVGASCRLGPACFAAVVVAWDDMTSREYAMSRPRDFPFVQKTQAEVYKPDIFYFRFTGPPPAKLIASRPEKIADGHSGKAVGVWAVVIVRLG